MSLNYVVLTVDVYDAQGNAPTSGSATFTPSASLTDTTNHEIVAQIPITVSFKASGVPTVKLLATDNATLAPPGWGWTVTFSGTGMPASFSFFLPYTGGASQNLSSIAPTSSVVTMAAYLPLSGGTLTGELAGAAVTLTDAATIAVNAIAGNTFRVTLGGNRTLGTPANPTDGQVITFEVTQDGTGSRTLGYSGAYFFPTSIPQPTLSTTPGDRDFIVFRYIAATSLWWCVGFVPQQYSSGGGSSGMTNPMTTLGDLIVENSTPAADRLAGTTSATKHFLTQTGTGSVSALPAWGTIATGDVPTLNQNTTGTAANITDTLDQVPTAAANVAMGSHKLTGLANGSGAQDSAAFGQIPVVEGSASNIKPVSTAAGLGSSGKWPDSDHVHLGFFGGIFGTGTDGALTFDGSTTPVGGATLSGSTYTMARDIQATSLTINNGVTLKPAGYRIFCQGTLTNNGTISAAGSAASGATQGGSTGSASLGGGQAGGAGGSGVSGTGANGTAANWGAAGGAGGAGTSGSAGSGGTSPAASALATNNILLTPYPILCGLAAYSVTTRDLMWGAGGGGGGSDASSNAGGGGGGGGGIVAIMAWAVNNGSGTITVQGGAGGQGTGGNAGGGGGGAGGLIVAYTLSAWTAGTLTVSGGTLGAKATGGTGSNGSNGGTGVSLNVVLA